MFAVDPLPDTAVECVAELEEIERLKAAMCARQARLTARLDETGVRPTTSEKAMATEVGLARHESPHRGARFLKLARGLVEDHPEVLGLLESGDLNERRAEIIVNETADLALADRRAADAAIADHLLEHPTLGDRDIADAARRIVLRIDEAAALRKRERAHKARHVESRTRADGCGEVTGVIADWQMAAIVSSLDERADLLKQQGDERTRAQIKADLFVERLTGQVVADSVPVRIDLVVPVESLLAGGTEPAEVPGLGPIPATVARELILASPRTRTVIRRLFADTDHLVAMESTQRVFHGRLRQFIQVRDRRCRTPWCDAPIRHLDHVHEAAEGGETSLHNGQGLCEACNYTKQDPGITHEVVSEDVIEPHTTRVTTPTGASYDSRAPAPPGSNPRDHFIQRQPGVWTRVA
ncbi:HNH endonuclease signature motif containing protein [Nocardioides sp.]|jgi:hypothetical protein|uniref:HNH endonuclease n=1 Tax=Nocardioides sp. TaxID=35761 RepID=UPI00261A2250|nr:HNH endonuclease signature motif containing protein [Nocardioides sp.]